MITLNTLKENLPIDVVNELTELNWIKDLLPENRINQSIPIIKLDTNEEFSIMGIRESIDSKDLYFMVLKDSTDENYIEPVHNFFNKFKLDTE